MLVSCGWLHCPNSVIHFLLLNKMLSGSTTFSNPDVYMLSWVTHSTIHKQGVWHSRNCNSETTNSSNIYTCSTICGRQIPKDIQKQKTWRDGKYEIQSIVCQRKKSSDIKKIKNTAVKMWSSSCVCSLSSVRSEYWPPELWTVPAASWHYTASLPSEWSLPYP